ncbi:polysaccharide biosynthesis/export family protein [Thermosulfurimonas dismutans]|uniref:Capsule polysaccharide export protein n=1 Tax=Thermosulfurimonas dismutans TaxID=999894 RepID=A0A179D4J8_9BACT|nr:polysaccharide biosynthesis/export family protein [Thermosulfurimonas dismutans]OAQ20538.1 Capsule polysaccharide export protein [Thermosulfurimonas dismutans]
MKRFIVWFIFLSVAFSMPVMAEGMDVPFYKIGPGDVLEISVWQDERLNRQVVVPPDGVISYPLIGDIKVTDLTVADLRRIITERLNDYVPDAIVTVMLVKINSLKAYVIGKVNRPGEFPINLDTDVMQILAMAGGLTPFASSKKIIILRREGDKIVKIPFNYDEVARGKNLEQNIILKRGDVVVVP